jgi:hypothetical protein
LDLTVSRLKLHEHFQAIHSRHFDIKQDEIGPEAFDGFETLDSVRCDADEIDLGTRCERDPQKTAQDSRVIDEQYANLLCRFIHGLVFPRRSD